MKSTLCYTLLCCLTGCSTMYPPWRSPVEYPIDYRNASNKNVTVITMTDERRSVIIVPGALHGKNADLRVCPEPPADASDNLSTLFKARLQAGRKDTKGEASLSDGTSTALSAIFPRSQGIELFRDGTQTLCLAWLNDVYNNGDINAWRDDFRMLLQLSYQLIQNEIKNPSAPASLAALPEVRAIPTPSIPDDDTSQTENSLQSQPAEKEPEAN